VVPHVQLQAIGDTYRPNEPAVIENVETQNWLLNKETAGKLFFQNAVNRLLEIIKPPGLHPFPVYE
jgi:hypothetical protein